MAIFSVALLTALPTGLSGEAAGAFVKVDGRECVLRAVELFLNRSNIKQIQLVVAPAQFEEAKRKFGAHLGFSGVKLVAGGQTWVEQIAGAAERLSDDCSHVLLHDAARPAVAYSDIDAILEEGAKHPIVALTAPVRNELVEVDPSGKAVAILPAQRFAQLVTPWVFEKEMFQAMARAKGEPDAKSVKLLRGSPLNVRASTAADASLLKTMINSLPKPKVRAGDNPFEEAQW
jgi:2-C-methyl-D-erythritol 4-phosphate cytidylyltransferase